MTYLETRTKIQSLKSLRMSPQHTRPRLHGTNGAYRRRQLDDAELDSGDDEGRADRAPEEEAEQFEEREFVSMDLEIPRQAAPEPSDGEV